MSALSEHSRWVLDIGACLLIVMSTFRADPDDGHKRYWRRVRLTGMAFLLLTFID